MQNYKTTITGIVTIVVALGAAYLTYTQGKEPDLAATLSAVAAGVGLIMARDAKKTDLTPTEAAVVKAQVANTNV